MDRIVFSLEQDGDLGDLGQSFDLIIEPMTSDASPDNYADYSVRGALGIQLVQAGDGRLQVYRIKRGGLFYTALRDMTGYKSLSNRVLEGKPRLTITRVRLFRDSDMLFDYHNVNGGLSAASLRFLLMTFAPHFIPDGTSADFVTSPPAATDGLLQNVAAALGLSALVGGSMITDSGYAGGMPMVGDVDLGGLGATQPEYGSMKPDFVVGDGESVIPSFKVAQTMVGDGQSTGLDLETIRYLTDGRGNFMIRTHFEGNRSKMAEDEMIDQDTEIMTMVGAAIKAVIEGLENHAKTKQRGMNDKERIARSAAAAVAVAVNKYQGRGIDLSNNEVLQMAIDNYNSRWSFGGPKIPVIRYDAQTLSSIRGYDI